MGPDSGVKWLSWPVSHLFKTSAVVVIAGAAVASLQLSLVRCGPDWTESSSEACRATASEGGEDPGRCVPLTWCPSLVASAGRGLRPQLCGSSTEQSQLVCCPSADVVSPTAPSADRLSVRQSSVDEGPRNERGCGSVDGDPRGIGRSKWPWMAAIFKGDKFLCGGSLLDRDTALTAAQCFYDFRNDIGMYKVRLGIVELNETVSSHGAELPILWIRRHERYRQRSIYNDIALVKTATKAPYGSHIGPVCLPQPDLKLSGHVVVLGWGLRSFGGRQPPKLQTRGALAISNDECNEIYRQSSSFLTRLPDGITEGIVCAANYTGVDACQGGSGGPMLAQDLDSQWNVVGIVSFGIRCGGRFPGGHTRVTAFLDWIARNRD
ncbi:clotting factor G beta subunit-like isoform X1 [Dermacentor andersoni]|uniref:clotting factor G beta subunit-like isoform X1 n=1 Tax=Dermacentor andersoni TaxID=34620 RepID=UPI003B3A4195